ncbi:aminopeptidase N [Kordiimonas aestuarii]|uniref:aminopeptidase N n=1 Tax=Kordiimonas aestuarii TaxID=1005925 RepID=UPI0021CEB282|nr:aminopeptidase N [Kordiimonas aestuarii]
MDASRAAVAPKQEIRLADYQPPAFSIDTVDLNFDLHDESAIVTATSRLTRQHGTGTLILDGGPYMTLKSIAVDGKPLGGNEYTLGAETLTIHAVPDRFTLEIVTELSPKENTRLEGLYFSGGNFCTQCEAEGFRHITYYPDRPDVLARYTVRIQADKARYPTLLSNGNPGETGDLPDGRHFAEWHDPHPKPSYLFAMVAGKLGRLSDSFTTCSGREIALNIFAAEGDLGKCDYAMASLKRSMAWDEDTFGLEYDLDVYNIVAVSDFNMGAMENKGLNIFNTKYVLASKETATDADFDHVEGVIGHEYFHNWTGNRVTCRDWFQLSLKEGLTVFRDQEFSSDMTSRAVKRLDDVRALRMMQFPEDGGPLAHPVRPERYIEINNFYTATVYNKGAEVIRMMHRLIGPDAFRHGMDLYFQRHDGQAVTCEDFTCAMEDASGVDLKQFRLWYSQAGTPALVITREREGGDLILHVEQSCAPTPGQPEKKNLHMPLLVGLVAKDGSELRADVSGTGEWTDDGCLLQVIDARQSYRFKNVPEGTVPSLLRGFTAPVTMRHDLTSEELAFLVQHDGDAFARWEAAQYMYGDFLLACARGAGKAEAPPHEIAETFKSLLSDTEVDEALLAELLALPSEISLGQRMDVLLPDEIHRVREGLASHFAHENADAVRARYAELSGASYDLDQTSKARRRLRNVLLKYLAYLPDAEALVCGHLEQADNMTDRMAALVIIAASDFPARDEMLAAFYNTWQRDDLVVDKWFAVQGQSSRPDAVEAVQQLMQHPAFKVANPNRLRSLISSFAMLNQVRFHTVDGAGYRLLADTIAHVDKINPQTAARLVAPLGRWRRLPEARQALMKAALEGLLAQVESADVRELVEKSLS